MNTEPNRVSFQNEIAPMAEPNSVGPKDSRREMKALFPPNDRFAAGSSSTGSGMALDYAEFPSSDFAAYTASPTDNQTVFRGTRPCPKIEEREKKEISDGDGETTRAELRSGEEGLSTISPVAPGSALIREVEARPFPDDESTESAPNEKSHEMYQDAETSRRGDTRARYRNKRNLRPARSSSKRRRRSPGCRMASRGRRRVSRNNSRANHKRRGARTHTYKPRRTASKKRPNGSKSDRRKFVRS